MDDIPMIPGAGCCPLPEGWLERGPEQVPGPALEPTKTEPAARFTLVLGRSSVGAPRPATFQRKEA
ncbi:hypothetical protein [Magnetospirillum aberrantis]|uniref:Uncharacterized protein n=1 Tax=Magnetospirillum aberrantis SpK TaxID=908842 RepID=A0A7C9QT32_9PROT|nr:hypothetical protein [Magnetospirillum aberrantis]NFV78796.1 hypothetical protein [Magnetospirillum aberrantis SpK]